MRQALHFVFKLGNRQKTAAFFTDLLQMKVLRHEEFEEGCKASCNGPYDGRWSKSMVGYGPEDNHFVMELTYNYGIGSYTHGNDFLEISIESQSAVEKCKNHPCKIVDDGIIVESPDGYKFHLINRKPIGDPVRKVTLASSNLKRTITYWRDLLAMTVYSQTDETAILGYAEEQVKLQFVDIGEPVKHETAFGRIAFSCPASQLSEIERIVKNAGHTILTPLISLDTPGKSTVQVVILADPDGHEICFVGDEAFRTLSQVDPNAGQLFNQAIAEDKSAEWFAKKGRSKESA